MSLFWTKDQLDDFGHRVRIPLTEELKARNAWNLVSNIVQSGHNVNPVVTIETPAGTRSFQIDFSPDNLQASDQELRALIARNLDAIGV
jgi:hypothetical protein